MESDEVMAHPRGNGLLALRVLLIALGALLGAVLLRNGFTVIGALVLVMAIVRAVMVYGIHRRRADRMRRRQQFVQRRRGQLRDG